MALERAADLGRSGNLVEARAKQLISEIVERAGGDPLTFRSLKEFSQEWLLSKASTKAEGTSTRYKGIMESFLGFLGDKKAKLNIASIAPRDVLAFRDYEVRQGKSETTANLALKTLRAFFNSARRQGLITSNPAEAVETFEAAKEQRDVFTNDQVKALFGVAPDEWKTMILLGYNLGARISDCARMTWRSVDLDAKIIRYMPQKTKRRGEVLLIPIMTELETHLLSLPSSDDANAPLCPSLYSKGTGGNRGLSSTFNRIMERAGVYGEQGGEKKGKGRRFKTLGFHSLRHTHTSELANAGVPAEVRQKITGHKDEKIHAIYTHLDLDTKRRALKKMPSITAKPIQPKKPSRKK
jgi:integrase